MKTLLFAFVVLFVFTTYSQESKTFKFLQEKPPKKRNSFTPPKKLLNNDIWIRVSDTRFECVFLRLAVEYQNFEFVLYEMDGQKRELSRAIKYSTISSEIANNTLRSTPSFSSNISVVVQ